MSTPLVRRSTLLSIGIALLAGTILASSDAGDASAQPQYTMKIGFVPMRDPLEFYAREIKQRLEPRSNDRIKVEIYPGGQLGSEPRLAEGLQLGTVEQASFPPIYLKGLDPRLQVAEAPGVFKNMTHAQKTVQDPAFRDHFLPLLEPKGMFGASIFVYNETSFASKKPIRTLEDFRGTKVRVIASDAERGMMASLGATGVPISLGELTPALQTGVVDVVRSGVSIFNIFKFYTIVKYMTLTRDTPVLTVSYISKIWLDKLPADLRAAVVETTRESAAATEPFVFKFVGDAVEAWKANGGEVMTLSPADQTELIRRAREVSDKTFGGDPALAPTYKLLLQTAAKYG